jgi:hypothetical protein
MPTHEEWHKLTVPQLTAECAKRGVQIKSKAKKAEVVQALLDFDQAQAKAAALAKAPAVPRGTPVRVVHDANIFQTARTPPSSVVSPPARIHAPPPLSPLPSPPAFFKQQQQQRSVPATAPQTRVAPPSPARSAAPTSFTPVAASRTVGSFFKSSSPKTVVPPLPTFDEDEDEDDAPVVSATTPRKSATRGVSPARTAVRKTTARDEIAEAEQAAHRSRLAKIAALVLAVVFLAVALGWAMTDRDPVVTAALQKLNDAKGASRCDESVVFRFTWAELLGELSGEDFSEAKLKLSDLVDVDKSTGKDEVVSAKGEGNLTIGCRLSLFASENWTSLSVAAVVLFAAGALLLRRQQAKWRAQRANALVREVFNVLKAQAFSFQQGGAAESFIAAVQLRDILLPDLADHGAFWEGVLAQVQRNTCVKTSGRYIGGAQTDVLEWVAPLAADHAVEAFRSPTRGPHT